MSKRLYLLYDGRKTKRAQQLDWHDPERAIVMCIEDSLEEAMGIVDSFGSGACYSYQDNGEGKEPTDERWEFDYDPETSFTFPKKK